MSHWLYKSVFIITQQGSVERVPSLPETMVPGMPFTGLPSPELDDINKKFKGPGKPD